MIIEENRTPLRQARAGFRWFLAGRMVTWIHGTVSMIALGTIGLLPCCDGVSQEVTSAQKEIEGETCQGDIDCADGFCNRGSCIAEEGALGRACDPRIESDAKSAVCGPFVCDLGRCRSCKADSECPLDLRCREGRCGGPAPDPSGTGGPPPD